METVHGNPRGATRSLQTAKQRMDLANRPLTTKVSPWASSGPLKAMQKVLLCLLPAAAPGHLLIVVSDQIRKSRSLSLDQQHPQFLTR